MSNKTSSYLDNPYLHMKKYQKQKVERSGLEGVVDRLQKQAQIIKDLQALNTIIGNDLRRAIENLALCECSEWVNSPTQGHHELCNENSDPYQVKDYQEIKVDRCEYCKGQHGRCSCP